MKTLLSTLALVLLCTIFAYAQAPIQDTIPQLKEWWRADDQFYAENGMTWLDNFYQGKGALVVWTPQGVQTWLLRFPGDTMNVFTWEKGSSNIKTGDFNGDGITDYVDENSNIYEGIKNGEPPKPTALSRGQSTSQTNYPEAIGDLNGDGLDDIINTPTIDHVVSARDITVCFGNKDVDGMNWRTFRLNEIDSNNTVISAYITPEKELRLLCRRYFWHYNSQYTVIDRDGLRLVRVRWDGSGFKSEILDEFTVDTKDGTGLYWVSALLRQPEGKDYFICATQIKGKVENTNLTVYDISNNKLEKRYSSRIDSISSIGVLHHSIDTDSIPEWFIAYFQTNGYSDVQFYSGKVENSLQPIGKYSSCQAPYGISLPIYSGSNIQNVVAIGANHGWCFRVVKLLEMVGVVSEEQHNNPFSIEIISPQPINNGQTLKLRLSHLLTDSYEISIFSNNGSNIFTVNSGQISVENKTISIPLSGYNFSKGVYWLRLRIGKEDAQQKFIIN